MKSYSLYSSDKASETNVVKVARHPYQQRAALTISACAAALFISQASFAQTTSSDWELTIDASLDGSVEQAASTTQGVTLHLGESKLWGEITEDTDSKVFGTRHNDTGFITELLEFKLLSPGQQANFSGHRVGDNSYQGTWYSAQGDSGDFTLAIPPAVPEGPAASCLDHLENFNQTADGIYSIDPDGVGGNDPFDVYCDMTTEGGGWTLVMRADSNTAGDWNTSGAWQLANSDNTGSFKFADVTINDIPKTLYRVDMDSPQTGDIRRYFSGDCDYNHTDVPQNISACRTSYSDTDLNNPRVGDSELYNEALQFNRAGLHDAQLAYAYVITNAYYPSFNVSGMAGNNLDVQNLNITWSAGSVWVR